MYLGIDLGTSNSAIVGNTGGDLKLYKTIDGYDVLPSAIMIDRRGAMFVGRRAYDQDAFSPENVAKRFKRLLGTTSAVTFKSAGRTMSPEDASSEILKTLLAQAQASAGEFDIHGAIVTTPAAFNQMQCEATMRAANAAGIERCGLLQEPIAAAMASIAVRQRKNATLRDGQFLVYDLGGGTFDVAIVQSIGGTVNIVGHSGVNMLGGTDFDRTIVNAIVRPWLLENFDLPHDLQKEPAFERVLRIGTFCSEKAKIEISTQPASTIFADESQIGTRDRKGRDIYLDIPLSRAEIEHLIIDQVDRSIEVCRTLLKESGYEPADIDRVVFIGGPTRMPLIRGRVPQQLAISADLDCDPMTAVAFGAAIYAESRDWKNGVATAKASRGSAHTDGQVHIEYGYPERTPDSRVRIRVKPRADAFGKGYRLQLDTDAGWTSGQLPLDATNSINDVPVGKLGDNHFRIVIFDASGSPIPNAETRFNVKRTDAAAAGMPVTHTIAVKIVDGEMGSQRNTLEPLVEKGRPLPANGFKDFRAASDLRANDAGSLDFEVYQMETAVADPALNLHVGAFRIASTYLERGDVIRHGDRIRVHWTLDENGLLDCVLEIEKIGRRFDTGKMFTDQGAQRNFEGPEGEELAKSVLDLAEAELDALQKTLGPRVAEATDLGRRVENQRGILKASYEADTRRSVAEEGRAIRQEISKINNRPENVGEVLRAEIKSLEALYDGAIRSDAGPAASERFDHLARQARESIAHGKTDDASKSVAEMTAICFDEARKQPGFVVNMFLDLAQERHFAMDKALHDRLVEAGKASIDRNDLNGLRSVIAQLMQNRYPTNAKDTAKMTFAGLMKW